MPHSPQLAYPASQRAVKDIYTLMGQQFMSKYDMSASPGYFLADPPLGKKTVGITLSGVQSEGEAYRAANLVVAKANAYWRAQPMPAPHEKKAYFAQISDGEVNASGSTASFQLDISLKDASLRKAVPKRTS